MKPKGQNNTPCTTSTSSKCVVWNGPAIPCLEICSGDNLSEAVYAIATKVCEINSSLDLSTVDLTCLIDHTAPENKSVRTILQLLLDNQCSLKQLIDDFTPGEATITLNLNLKCLKKFDEFENEIPQNLNQVLQSLVNQACTNKDGITNLNNITTDLQDQIDNLPIPAPYVEPSITTCITGIAKKTSVAVPLIAQDLCDYKSIVGTDVDITDALGKQCKDLNITLGSTLGWDNNPQSMADSLGNLWIAYCNLLNRVKVIERSCCGPTCSKIKLGFVVTFNDDGTVDFDFTAGAGTFIPDGFTDCGSVITLTDRNGITFTPSNTVISQEGTVAGVNISSLAQGPIQVGIKTKFCLADAGGKTILTCQDCINLEFMNTNGCCVLTNTGSTAQSIIYETIITTP